MKGRIKVLQKDNKLQHVPIQAVDLYATDTVGDLVIRLRKQVGIKPEYKIVLLHKLEVLNETMRITDFGFFSDSTIMARVFPPEEAEQKNLAIRVAREISFIPPTLPEDKNEGYFIFCSKHAEGNQLNRAGIRGYCKKDKCPYVTFTGKKENWVDLFESKVSDFECDPLDEDPTCDNDPTHFGYYFVCQGPIDHKYWTSQEMEENYRSAKRNECKAYSYCGHSGMFNFVYNNKRQLRCCKTMESDEIMLKFTGCDHAFSKSGLKAALDNHNIKNLLVRNTNENKKYFGEYFISCPYTTSLSCPGVMAVYALKGFDAQRWKELKDFIGDPESQESESKEVVLDDSFYRNKIQEILLDKFRTCCGQECEDLQYINKCVCRICEAEYCYCGENGCDCPELDDPDEIAEFSQRQPPLKLSALYDKYLESGQERSNETWKKLIVSCGVMAEETWDKVVNLSLSRN